MSEFFQKINNFKAYQSLADDTRGNSFTTAFGVQQTEKPFVASALSDFVLYVCTDYVESQRILRTLQALGNKSAVYLPAREDVLLYKRSFSHESVNKRNAVLCDILCGKTNCVVTTVETLTQFLPSKKVFEESTFTVAVGGNFSTDLLAQKFVFAGYVRADAVTSVGEFSIRGDTLDVLLPGGERYRTSFWGDEVEEIRKVDSDNTSAVKAQSFTVVPLFDVTPVSAQKLQEVFAVVNRQKCSPNAKSRLTEIVDGLTLSAGNGSVANVWLTPFTQADTLANYLPSGATVVFDEPKLVVQRIDFLANEHAKRVVNLAEAGEALPLHQKSMLGRELLQNYASFHKLCLQTLPYQTAEFSPEVLHNFKTTAVVSYAGRENQLATDIRNWKRTGYEVVLFAGTENVADLRQKLADLGAFAVQNSHFEANQGDALIVDSAIERGFVSHSNKLVVVGTRDLGRGMSSATMRKTKKQAFLSVEKGDYVVHDFHGIGLCEGIEKIKTPSGEEKDYIAIMYKGGSHLYVPVDASDLLSRYSGGENPTLSRLGGDDFDRVKQKVKSGIKEMSLNLLKLYAEREKKRGFSYQIDEYLHDEFNRRFAFTPTADQVKCQKEIFDDLASPNIMDRLLVGDVGFGKTEVAMRTAFAVVANGYQVAVLVPTTILAEQHFQSFSARMKEFDVKVACVNRFHSQSEIKRTLKDVADGKIDILIGTHRLLSKDVQFAKLGLLVLDEEQRFGVEHKEKIKAMKTNVDVLTLSATPIPRTLHMALSGIRDISTLTTPPALRIPVETSVVEDSDTLVRDIIDRELSREGQVFFVYNKVQSIDVFANRLRSLVPNAKIAVAHGQMPENLLEDTVVAFQQGKYNVLLCSTIIENGIDMPNANTLIVYDADEFGLSQLYQLRGRVGRSNRVAYAYFLYRQNKVLSEIAYKRLASVTEYSELGSGFKIAMKDLEIRGAGNILGREQHGHMVKVGYEMYARLLKEAVAELKGESVKQKINVELDVDTTAFAPESYIPSQKERIDFYQQLAGCESTADVAAVSKQVTEVYGVPPKEVNNLIALSELKLHAKNAGVKKISVKAGRGVVTFATREDMMRKEVFDALCELASKATVAQNDYAIVFESADYLQKSRLMAELREFLIKIAQTNKN